MIKYNMETNEISLDIEAFKRVAEWIKQLQSKKLGKEESDFIKCKQFLDENRITLSRLAAEYYRNAERNPLLPDWIPLFVPRQYLPTTLIAPESVDLRHLAHDPYPFAKSAFASGDLLPNRVERLSEVLIRLSSEQKIRRIHLNDNPVYRLLNVVPTELGPQMCFANDVYFNYVDTCEMLAFEFAKEVLQGLEEANKKNSTDLGYVRSRFDNLLLRKTVGFENFDSRCCSVGISTLLVFLDKDREGKSTFFIHDRRTGFNVEAPNTLHVIPAGTFQPRHLGKFSEDFSLYRNIMRELGEELLGYEELNALSQDYDNVLELPRLREFHELINTGFGKIYYLGLGFDYLTTKPEMLTAMVLDKKQLLRLMGSVKFHDTLEGKRIEEEFNDSNLQEKARDPQLLPAGAACLELVRRNLGSLLELVMY